MVHRCDHCGKRRVLVCVVKSEFYSMEVCSACAILAARLISQYPRGDDGQIAVESLDPERPYTDWLQRISRN
jgi:hypothetical protein